MNTAQIDGTADSSTASVVPIYLTPREVSDRLRVQVGTLRRWRSDGRGPRYVKLTSGCTRYRFEDVLAYELAGDSDRDARNVGETS